MNNLDKTIENSKPRGTSIIFVNENDHVLLFLRDNIPSIPFPNCWDILGGHIEEGETPEQCIVREMQEEIGQNIENLQVFNMYDMKDRMEYTFWKKANLDISKISLTEGQKLKWFSEEEIRNMPEQMIAFDFKAIILQFFKEAPFK